jgi:hypothetical protein
VSTQPPLFDGYGKPRPAKRVPPAPDYEEIRVCEPWVLLTSPAHAPRAHLLDHARAKTRHGSVFARCGAAGQVISVPGTPLAPVCGTCRRIHGPNRPNQPQIVETRPL